MKNEIQTAAAKQEYQTPQLSEFGAMSDLTKAGGANANDGVNASAN